MASLPLVFRLISFRLFMLFYRSTTTGRNEWGMLTGYFFSTSKVRHNAAYQFQTSAPAPLFDQWD
jgi:hypothetical protein